MAERAIEVSELKQTLAQALKDKEQLQEVKRHRFNRTVILLIHAYLSSTFSHFVTEQQTAMDNIGILCVIQTL